MSLVVGTIEELEYRLNAFGVALVGAPLGRQLIEALARAEKAEERLRKLHESYDFVHEGRGRQRERAEQAERERDEARSELDRCKAFCRERIQEIHQWERWADLSPRGANVDAPPSNAMHAAAEELRAQGTVLPEAHSGSPSGECPKCNGTGRSCGNGRCAYQWCASCKACNGTGRKTEESDGKSSAQMGAEQVEVTDAPMRVAEHVAAISGQPEAGDLQALHRADASKRFKKLASAIVLSVAESDPGDPATDLVVHHDKLRAIIVEALENEVHADAPVPSEKLDKRE